MLLQIFVKFGIYIYTNLVALNMIKWDFIIKKAPQTVNRHKVSSLLFK